MAALARAPMAAPVRAPTQNYINALVTTDGGLMFTDIHLSIGKKFNQI
jgi:hypothetical protein